MAKISTPTVKKLAAKPAPRNLEPDVDLEAEEVGGEDAVAVEEIDPATDMVRVSINTEIEPAPRVGGIDMVRDFGVSKLTKGIHSVPRVVAVVLVDKGLAQMI